MGYVFKVKKWFREQLKEEMKAYFCLPTCEYVETGTAIGCISDDTKLRIDEIRKVTEKAVKVVIEVDSFSGRYTGWVTWIPKSVIENKEVLGF